VAVQLKPETERLVQEEIESARKPRRNLADILSEPPCAGSELNLERQQDYPRPLDL
jgi:hypothetical protein